MGVSQIRSTLFGVPVLRSFQRNISQAMQGYLRYRNKRKKKNHQSSNGNDSSNNNPAFSQASVPRQRPGCLSPCGSTHFLDNAFGTASL